MCTHGSVGVYCPCVLRCYLPVWLCLCNTQVRSPLFATRQVVACYTTQAPEGGRAGAASALQPSGQPAGGGARQWPLPHATTVCVLFNPAAYSAPALQQHHIPGTLEGEVDLIWAAYEVELSAVFCAQESQVGGVLCQKPFT